jgi:hypothetical protein
LQFMQQFYFNHLPLSFNNMWLTNARRRELQLADQDQEPHDLRNEGDFHVSFSRLSSSDRHPLINFPKTWNEFAHPEIKSTAHKSVFNTQLKKHFIDELDPNYKCTRLLCPHCHL